MTLSTLLLVVAAVALVVWIGRLVRTFNRVPARPRQSVPDDGMDLHAADSFFHPTGRPGALVALAREGYRVIPEKTEAADVTVPASRTKEIDSLASYK